MPKILFWNVNKKDLTNLVCEAAQEQDADVVILIENIKDIAHTLAALQSKVSKTFSHPKAVTSRFQLFTRQQRLGLNETYSGHRVSLRQLHLKNRELLFGIIHVVDKYNWDEAQQLTEVQLLSSEIRKVEQDSKNDRTVLIGDFNMNPFDKAMNLAQGMNSMMTRKCVQAGYRTVQDRRYPYFYNPMWSLMGDSSSRPVGTFYHRNSARGFFGWNMLDQVLVRPSAIEDFDNVKILDSVGNKLLGDKNRRPAKCVASDHFPILLTLK